LDPVVVYNCSVASLVSLTVNGKNALTSSLAPFTQSSPAVSFVTLSTAIFTLNCSVCAYFYGQTKPAWTVPLPFSSNLPAPTYSLWCYYNGLYLCNSQGIITSSFLQKLSVSAENPVGDVTSQSDS
jgi:hypothetical protein